MVPLHARWQGQHRRVPRQDCRTVPRSLHFRCCRGSGGSFCSLWASVRPCGASASGPFCCVPWSQRRSRCIRASSAPAWITADDTDSSVARRGHSSGQRPQVQSRYADRQNGRRRRPLHLRVATRNAQAAGLPRGLHGRGIVLFLVAHLSFASCTNDNYVRNLQSKGCARKKPGQKFCGALARGLRRVTLVCRNQGGPIFFGFFRGF